MSDWLYEYFTRAEMKCKCGCGGLPKPELMEKITALRDEAGFPMIVSSGFRCADYNARVSSTGRDGPHVRGLACDFQISGEPLFKVLGIALRAGFTGIGLSQKGTMSNRFLHLDIVPTGDAAIPRPRVWSY